MKTLFKNIQIGKFFLMGSTKWVKQSSRTARKLCGSDWFYFGKNESVISIPDPTDPN